MNVVSSTEIEQRRLDKEVEELELYDMTPEEISRQVNELSLSNMEIRKIRKNVRYLLYRLQTEVKSEGTNLAPEKANNQFKQKFTSQELFDGWKNFSITWDVALSDPFRIVHRTKSLKEEWDELVKAKYPVLDNGVLSYPDKSVEAKVLAEIQSNTANNQSDN